MDETSKEDLTQLEGLIRKYKAYKKNFTRSFRFDPSATGDNFGTINNCVLVFTLNVSGKELDDSLIQVVQIYFDTASFDEIERDKKIKLESQISLIGGTMGLFTGFSIISGIEIIYFAIKIFFRSTTPTIKGIAKDALDRPV